MDEFQLDLLHWQPSIEGFGRSEGKIPILHAHRSSSMLLLIRPFYVSMIRFHPHIRSGV